MHNEAIENNLVGLIKKNYILVIIGLLLITVVGAASYSSASSPSKEIVFSDKDGNSMTLNPSEHSFIVKNFDGFIVSGTYTETSESYNCRNDQGSGETMLKEGTDKIEYKGHVLTRKY
jgi:hypothetical protein